MRGNRACIFETLLIVPKAGGVCFRLFFRFFETVDKAAGHGL